MGALSLGSNHWPEHGYVRGPDEEGDVAGLSGTPGRGSAWELNILCPLGSSCAISRVPNSNARFMCLLRHYPPSHPCPMLTDCKKFQVQANAYCIFHDNSKLLQYLRASHLPSAWRTNGQKPSETSERPPCHTLTRLLYSEPPRKLRRGQRQ
jgi:hypothetical protein